MGLGAPRGERRPLATRSSVETLLVIAACVMAGCIAQAPDYRPGSCPLEECSDWTYQRFVHEEISVVGFHKPGRPAGPLVVYIEGDGNAWHSRSEMSGDPTPRDPIGLRLASLDPASRVLYLARPCQFLNSRFFDRCDPWLWTAGRYSADVVQAMSHAITVAKHFPEERLALVGYSGGGVIATLIASRRSDVEELITVAAPLDTVAWTEYHRVTPLEDSLNPLENAPTPEFTRVIHFHGGQDEAVPPVTLERYRLQRPSEYARFVTVREFDHRCCWVRDWTKLLAMIRNSDRIP